MPEPITLATIVVGKVIGFKAVAAVLIVKAKAFLIAHGLSVGTVSVAALAAMIAAVVMRKSRREVAEAGVRKGIETGVAEVLANDWLPNWA